MRDQQSRGASCIGAMMLLLLSGAACWQTTHVLWDTVHRHSPNYALVQGTLRNSDFLDKPRISYTWQGHEGELSSAEILLPNASLRELRTQHGYVPVCVRRSHPAHAAVAHELTPYGLAWASLPYLLFLCGLGWLAHNLRRTIHRKRSRMLRPR